MQVPNSASSALQSSSSATDFARMASSPSLAPTSSPLAHASFSGSASASSSADGRSLKRALELSAPGSGIGELDSSEQQLKTDITGKARRIAPTDSAGVLGLSSSSPSSSTSLATHSSLQASFSNSHVLDSRVSSLSLSSGPAALMSEFFSGVSALFEMFHERREQELRLKQEILRVEQETLHNQQEALHVANATLQIETARVAAERSAQAAAVALAAAGSLAKSPSRDADRNSVRLTGILPFDCLSLLPSKCSHCSCSLVIWHFRRSTESRRQRPRSRRVRRLPSHPHRATSSISLTIRVTMKCIWPIGFLHRPRLPRLSRLRHCPRSSRVCRLRVKALTSLTIRATMLFSCQASPWSRPNHNQHRLLWRRRRLLLWLLRARRSRPSTSQLMNSMCADHSELSKALVQSQGRSPLVQSQG